MQTLLSCNDSWNDNTQDYLEQTCLNSAHVYQWLYRNRLKRHICVPRIGHLTKFFALITCILAINAVHVMDTKTTLFAGVVCSDTSLSNAIYALQVCWLMPFWSPKGIRRDNAFNRNLFTDFAKVTGYGVGTCASSPSPEEFARIEAWYPPTNLPSSSFSCRARRQKISCRHAAQHLKSDVHLGYSV